MKRIILTLTILFVILASTALSITNKNSDIEKPDSVSLQALMQKDFNGSGLKVGNVLDDNNAYTRYYITYKSDKYTISGIMNVPKGKGPFPVIILAHGYIDPKYYTVGRGLKREQDYLARHGYVVIHTDYRNHGDSSKDPDNDYKLYTGYIEDVINAVYAVKRSNLPYFDKENIGMLGHSLGGGIALSIMVTKPKLVKAYVLFAPISIDYRDNFERWINKRGPGVPWKYGSPNVRDKIIAKYGTPSSNPKFWDNISVKTYLKNVADPVIVHHGTADDQVPLDWSKRLVSEFKKHNKDITLYIYNGEKHEFISAWPLVMKRTVEFFDANFKIKNIKEKL